MVKGSHPFRESGKLRVGVAEIEMIPTVGSEISGENPPFGCIKLLNYHVNLRGFLPSRVNSMTSRLHFLVMSRNFWLRNSWHQTCEKLSDLHLKTENSTTWVSWYQIFLLILIFPTKIQRKKKKTPRQICQPHLVSPGGWENLGGSDRRGPAEIYITVSDNKRKVGKTSYNLHSGKPT